MGTKLSPPDEELYRRTDEVLHYIWDPVGAAGSPMARDEYYSYLPHVFQLLKTGASADEIAKYLFEIETDRMGLNGGWEGCCNVAAILQDWKDKIDSERA